MATIGRLWETNPVEYLVSWKFPKLAVFRHEVIRESNSISDEEWRDLQEKAEAYREELRFMTKADIQPLITEARQDEIKRYNDHQESEERKRFFNRPHANADFVHWASASYWTLDEATALSLGKDPRVVTWKNVLPHEQISPFAKCFADRRDLINRAKVMGQLYDQTIPPIFLAWAERMRIPTPAELAQAVKALGIQIGDWKTLYDDAANEMTKRDELIEAQSSAIALKEKHLAAFEMHVAVLNQRIEQLENKIPSISRERSLGARERESLLKLVIGMATDGYGYDPKAARSPTAKELASNLALLGLSIDEDTVRKYLNEAKTLLPGDETEFG